MTRPWWREAVLYEVYVRSFADASGDGIGDLPGVRSKLSYLRALGVDGLWLTPFYVSPGADHGYDVADHCDVDPQLGTLADFDALLADAHALGLRVLVDLVPNHTSIEHPWFREHPDRYLWRDGRGEGPPNTWQSSFGGPAWTRDERTGRWYLHLFAPEQPDLDWRNPEVERAFDGILRFWLDRGVDGFRIDVAHGLFKDPTLADHADSDPAGADPALFADQWTALFDRPEVHPVYRRWRRLTDAYDGERVLVGEVVLRDQERVARYLRPDELHLAFDFAFLREEWDAERLRRTIDRTLGALARVGASATWVLENHDVPRLPTRLGGGGAEGLRRARAAALLLLALPGTAFLYQGQELGLEEVDLPDELRRDPIFLRSGGARKGRDGCRVPMPWTRQPPGHGFTAGRPWLPTPPGWGERSVEAEETDARSTLSLFRAALARRPHGPFAWRDSPPGTLAFERGDVVCLVNVDAEPLSLPPGELLVASEPVADRLPAGAAAWIRARPGRTRGADRPASSAT